MLRYKKSKLDSPYSSILMLTYQKWKRKNNFFYTLKSYKIIMCMICDQNDCIII